MKFFNRYFTPTPKKFRIIGDCLMVVGSGITGSAMFFNTTVLQCAVFIGVFGKIITNFASENNTDNNINSNSNTAA